jgi:hypothetical protein
MTTTTQLLPAIVPGAQIDELAERERFQMIRAALPEMDADTAAQCAIYADAMAAAATARMSLETAREAIRTRAYAERRLGELMAPFWNDEPIAGAPRGTPRWAPMPDALKALQLDYKRAGALVKLSDVPQAVFDEIIADLSERDKQCDAFSVIRAAHRETCEPIEPGIDRAWDGTLFVQANGPHGIRRSPHDDLERTRQWMHDEFEAKRVPKGAGATKIEAVYTAARNASLDCSKIRDTARLQNHESHAKLAKAELLLMKAASLLWSAYTAET